jgi:hypothetical protein
MKDIIGKRPQINNKQDALFLIKDICNYKRKHLMLSDEYWWLELKLKEIKKIAKKGIDFKD